MKIAYACINTCFTEYFSSILPNSGPSDLAMTFCDQLCSEACIISCVIILTILLVIRYDIEKCHSLVRSRKGQTRENNSEIRDFPGERVVFHGIPGQTGNK